MGIRRGKPSRIRIAQWKQTSLPYLPLYVADLEGFFDERGVQVQIDPVGNDHEVFGEVLSGKAWLGLGDPTFCARKEFVSTPTGVIATIVDRVAFWGLAANELISPVRYVEDLVQLRVGCFPRPSTSYSLIAATKSEHKRLLRSMEIVEGEIGKLAALIEEGRCDLILDYEPYVSLAEERGYRAVYSLPDFHGPFALTGLYALSTNLAAWPEIARAIVGGINEALGAIETSDEIALRVARKVFPQFSAGLLSKAIGRLKAERVWRKDPRTMETSFLAAIKVRKSIGEKFITSPGRVINDTFFLSLHK